MFLGGDRNCQHQTESIEISATIRWDECIGQGDKEVRGLLGTAADLNCSIISILCDFYRAGGNRIHPGGLRRREKAYQCWDGVDHQA